MACAWNSKYNFSLSDCQAEWLPLFVKDNVISRQTDTNKTWTKPNQSLYSSPLKSRNDNEKDINSPRLLQRLLMSDSLFIAFSFIFVLYIDVSVGMCDCYCNVGFDVCFWMTGLIHHSLTLLVIFDGELILSHSAVLWIPLCYSLVSYLCSWLIF